MAPSASVTFFIFFLVVTVEFTQAEYEVDEGEGQVKVCLSIDAPIATPLTVALESTPLSAAGELNPALLKLLYCTGKHENMEKNPQLVDNFNSKPKLLCVVDLYSHSLIPTHSTHLTPTPYAFALFNTPCIRII